MASVECNIAHSNSLHRCPNLQHKLLTDSFNPQEPLISHVATSTISTAQTEKRVKEAAPDELARDADAQAEDARRIAGKAAAQQTAKALMAARKAARSKAPVGCLVARPNRKRGVTKQDPVRGVNPSEGSILSRRLRRKSSPADSLDTSAANGGADPAHPER